ncbi:hypothetical protein LZ198_25645 [Myxococcus sp. K15C18031901]|uniref:hypothetical protein n=1 Tax=Myxococcus dinghuensis TaxID=2906761 RepID=UPI0020A7227A|nr:hypothetical protein [Myxococcus dinghuensis]MCP3102258.1 hypothetical protein [Myxococcus dinghuensis]
MRSALLVALGVLFLGAAPALATSPAPPRMVVTHKAASVATVSGEKAPNGYRVSSASTETATEGSLRATFTMSALRPPWGFTSFQVVVNNTGARPLPVRVRFQSTYSQPERGSTRDVEVGPHQRVVVWLPVPEVLSSGELSVESPGLPAIRRYVYSDDHRGGALLVLGGTEDFERATGLTKAGEEDEPHFAARFVDVKDAPRELASYLGFNAVAVTVAPESIPADLWAVLEAHVLTGGRVLFTQPLARTREHLPLLSGELGPSPALYGFGELWACKAPVEFCLPKLQEMLDREEPSRGVVSPLSVGRDTMPGAWIPAGQDSLLSSARAPVGRLLLFILTFVAVVGPGAWMLARRRGPTAVLVVIPSVSLVTCLLLISWSVLVDGFATHTARYSMTWLDDARSRAVTVGVGAWYANLSHDSVRLTGTSVLVGPPSSTEETAELDWTNGQHLGMGFLPARTYREWGEVAVRPTRARLVVLGDDRVQNALGAPVEEGYVRWRGALRKLPPMKDGEEGRLGASEPPGDAEPAAALVAQSLEPDVSSRLTHDKQSFRAELPEGGFIARLSGPGPMPTADLETTLEKGVHLVRGTVREERR